MHRDSQPKPADKGKVHVDEPRQLHEHIHMPREDTLHYGYGRFAACTH